MRRVMIGGSFFGTWILAPGTPREQAALRVVQGGWKDDVVKGGGAHMKGIDCGLFLGTWKLASGTPREQAALRPMPHDWHAAQTGAPDWLRMPPPHLPHKCQ